MRKQIRPLKEKKFIFLTKNMRRCFNLSNASFASSIYFFTMNQLGYFKKVKEPDFDFALKCVEISRNFAQTFGDDLINHSYNTITKPFSQEIFQDYSGVKKLSVFDYLFTIPLTYKDPTNAKYIILKRYYNNVLIGCCYGLALSFIIEYLNNQKFINRENGPTIDDIKKQNDQLFCISINGKRILDPGFMHFWNNGIKVTFSKTIYHDNRENFYLLKHIKNYENGVYYCSIHFTNGYHSTAFVKNDDGVIFFDPNYGTVKIGKNFGFINLNSITIRKCEKI